MLTRVIRSARCTCRLAPVARGLQHRSKSSWEGHRSHSRRNLTALGGSLALAAAALQVCYSSSTNVAVAEEEPPPGPKLARRNSMRRQKRHYPYVIVGAGTTAHAAIEAIRQADPDADILILSDESSLPRSDLVDVEEEDPICDEVMDTYNEWRRHVTSKLEAEPDAYSSGPVTLSLGRRDIHFDVENNQILLQDGTEIHYDKCLIASAGKPRNFYVLDSNKISYALKDNLNPLNTLQDFQDLNAISKRSDIQSVTVVGGGFLGTEVAATLATNRQFRSRDLKVHQVFVESAPLSRYLPPYLSRFVTKKLRGAGVNLISDRVVTGIKKSGGYESNDVVISLLGYEKEKLDTNYVVLASTHIDPKVRVARDSGLEIDKENGGIVVNAQLEAMSGLYVAGNAASYYDPALGRRRVDMYDHAVNSGLQAGQNMVAGVGKSKMYTHQPMFRSNMGGIGILVEGVGQIDSNLKTVGVFLANRNEMTGRANERTRGSEFNRGIVYYLKGTKIVGILLWNASDALERARMLINQQPPVQSPEDLRSMISLAPDNWLDVIVS